MKPIVFFQGPKHVSGAQSENQSSVINYLFTPEVFILPREVVIKPYSISLYNFDTLYCVLVCCLGHSQ